MQAAFIENAVLAVLVAGITPIPFHLAAIASGAFSMAVASFLAAVFAIRLIRFVLMAAMIRLFGAGLDVAMNRHGSSLAIICVVLAALALVTPLLLF